MDPFPRAAACSSWPACLVPSLPAVGAWGPLPFFPSFLSQIRQRLLHQVNLLPPAYLFRRASTFLPLPPTTRRVLLTRLSSSDALVFSQTPLVSSIPQQSFLHGVVFHRFGFPIALVSRRTGLPSHWSPIVLVSCRGGFPFAAVFTSRWSSVVLASCPPVALVFPSSLDPYPSSLDPFPLELPPLSRLFLSAAFFQPDRTII